MAKVSWEINVTRGDWDDEDHLRTSLQFNSGDSWEIKDKFTNFMVHLIKQDVIYGNWDDEEYSDSDQSTYMYGQQDSEEDEQADLFDDDNEYPEPEVGC